MGVSLKHKFASGKSNGTDATLVQPSNWNDEHNLTLNGNSVLGNATGGNAAAAEVPMGTLGASILASGTLADLIAAGVPIFTTGDAKLTFKTSADTGWIMAADQTIGNTSSGATYANVLAQALYTLLWNNISNTYAPVTGGRGGSAAADWAAQKPLQLTLMLGRALAISGTGSGLTARALGQNLGEETHLLSTGEMPAHNHGVTDPTHTHTIAEEGAGQATVGSIAGSGGNSYVTPAGGPFGGQIGSSATGVTIQNAGGGAVHNNMQPTSFLNVMIKL
jgi:microcystin-dependent protein